MRVIIATIQVPFVRGGAEVHAENLRDAIISSGNQCEIVAIPFKWYPPERIIDHILACRLLDLSETNGQSIDLLIGLRFPAYLIPHNNKVLWILHQFRTAYELWDTPFGDLIHHPNGRHVREVIRAIDKKIIPEAKEIYTNSLNVSKRLEKYNNINSKPLYHPPPNADKFYCNEAEDYIFFPSRLNSIKRQELAIKALAKTRSSVKLLITGKADVDSFALYLKELVEKSGLKDRIKFLGPISEKEKLEYYSRALAVIYPPVDEDYGYVTLEAMLASKAVITCSDSGGPLEFIINGENGFISEPSEEDLADAMDQAFTNRSKTVTMGQAGRKRFDSMKITWQNVVEVLLK